MKRIVFILNSKVSKKNKIVKSIERVFSSDFQIEIKETKERNHASLICTQSIDEGTDFIISVGGDGTINETINGFMKAETEKRDKVIFGVLPSGTGNDFARTLQLTKSVEQLYFLLKKENYQIIDLGEAVFSDLNGEKNSRYFVNIADIGVGASTVKIVNGSSKYLGANITFVLGIIRAFIGYKHQKIRLLYNNLEHRGKIVSVVFANGNYFGSGLGIAPDASVNDGLFDLVIIGNVKVFDFIRYLPTLKKKKKILHPEVFYRKAAYCKIESLEKQDLPIEMDGEYVGNTPLELKIVPQMIKFLKV